MSEFFQPIVRKVKADFEFEPSVAEELKATRKRAAAFKGTQFSLDAKVERYLKKQITAANKEMDELQRQNDHSGA